MVVGKTVNLTFPVNSLQVINYTVVNYAYYNLYLPLVNADTQMGTEITVLKVNGVGTATAANSTNQFFLAPASGNLIYSGTGSSTTINSASYVSFFTYVKLIAMRTGPGVYGWYIVNVS